MKTTHIRPVLAAAAFSTLLFAAMPAWAADTYTADLKGTSEVPANETKGTGKVDASFDAASKKFTWTVTYSGLTGPATAAHFHGPAEPGKNAPPVVPIKGSLASPIKGEETLTDAQVADLQGGKWYFNIHTEANKPGEIRGQMTKK